MDTRSTKENIAQVRGPGIIATGIYEGLDNTLNLG